MTPKRVLSAVVLAMAGVPALAGASGTGGARIVVTPSSGTPRTRFVVRFTAPRPTGRFVSFQRHNVLDVAGPAGAGWCVSQMSVNAPDSAANARVRVVLNPARLANRWCPGVFSGRIEEFQEATCPQGQLCPHDVVLLGTVGTFEFRVNPRH